MRGRIWREVRGPALIGFGWSFGADYVLHLSAWSWSWLAGLGFLIAVYVAGLSESV